MEKINLHLTWGSLGTGGEEDGAAHEWEAGGRAGGGARSV